MDSVIAFLSGAFHKLYDDITDNNVKLSEFQLELLKVLMVTLMTIFFIQSPTTSFLFMIAVVIYWFLGNIDNNFWKSCMVIPFITSLSTIPNLKFLGIFDLLQRATFITIFAGSFFVEEKLFPEETSIPKTMFRVAVVLIVPIIIWLTRNLSCANFIRSFGMFVMGYLVSNLGFHFMMSTASHTEK